MKYTPPGHSGLMLSERRLGAMTFGEQGPRGADEATEEARARRAAKQNRRILEMLDKTAKARQASCSRIALAWLPTRQAADSVAFGARTVKQPEGNPGAAKPKLTGDELQQSNTASTPPETRPHRRVIKLHGSR